MVNSLAGCERGRRVNQFLHAPVKKISTLVLIDRNHKRFPVNADYVGLSLATTLKQNIKVVFSGVMDKINAILKMFCSNGQN
jgi:pyrimidine operon attenuation protein/uracil phosphoribosyltransferase